MKFGLAPPEDIQTVDELEAYLKDFEAHVRRLDTPIRGGPRRHHYIPQFYMKRFAHNGKRLIRMPLPTHPTPSRKPTNVTKLAVMRDFYTVLTEKGESAVIENLLGVWDHDASECFKKLTDKNAWPISPNLKMRMCFWFALLFVRSPCFRRSFEAMSEFTLEFAKSTGREGNDPSDLWSLWNHQNESINLMLRVACELIEHLAARQWQVLSLNSKEGLALTDSGCFQVPGPSHGVHGVGFSSAAEVLVPLDRHHLLCMHAFESAGEGLVELDSEASPYLATHYNNMLISSAYQEVFCHQNDYDHVLSIAEKHVRGPLMGVQGPIGNLRVDGVNFPPERQRPRRYRAYGAPTEATETRQPNEAAEQKRTH